MPKEVIDTKSPTKHTPPAGAAQAGYVAPGERIEVRWDKNADSDTGHVRLQTSEVPWEEPGQAPPGVFGQSVHVDRAQINRLIRALRKARDQAYGSDA